MADSKMMKVSITNQGRGPRTFFQGNGESVMLRPGESFDGELSEGDHRDLHSDLAHKGEDGGGSGTTNSLFDFPSLDGLSHSELLSVARSEGYSALGNDSSLEDTRAAIEAAREASSQGLQGELVSLNKLSGDKLRKTAADEGVAVETDDNKADLAVKIAQARAAKAS